MIPDDIFELKADIKGIESNERPPAFPQRESTMQASSQNFSFERDSGIDLDFTLIVHLNDK
jgi:hypothetical protein